MYDGILPFHRATAPNFAYDKKRAAADGGGFIIFVRFFLLWNNISYIHTISYHLLRTGGGSTDTILNFFTFWKPFSLIYLYKEINSSPAFLPKNLDAFQDQS